MVKTATFDSGLPGVSYVDEEVANSSNELEADSPKLSKHPANISLPSLPAAARTAPWVGLRPPELTCLMKRTWEQ